MGSLEVARSVLQQEASALQTLASDLDDRFVHAVDWIVGCKGKVVTCGLGKSGHIARKASGTFSSTGTPSFFLHAVEAVHGDLGMLEAGDIVILYSQSGETDEIVALYPTLRELGALSVTITGRAESSAGRAADLVLDTGVREEACPMNLAPTTSTTAMLALSDALAIAAMDRRQFTREDFRKLHPRGTLGRRLTVRVSDVMRPIDEIAVLAPDASGIEVIQAMTTHGVGAACIVEDDQLVGLISDGDWRRHTLQDNDSLHRPARSMMNPRPTVVEPDLLAIEAIETFQNAAAKIGDLPVAERGRLLGLLVLKDLLRSGII